VVVRLFAGPRERAGTDRREVDLGDGAVLDDVWPALGLGVEPRGLHYAVNREYAEAERPLSDGDEAH
jgi:molybdopterin converting factor small subunit